MGFVSVEELKQGMILSEDVRDINSRLLLSKGQKIASNHLRILKIWGVAEVNVVGSSKYPPTCAQEVDPEKLQKATAAVDAVFKNLDKGNKTIQQIYQSPVSYRYRKNLMDMPDSSCHPARDSIGFKGSEIAKKINKSNLKLPEAPSIIAELNQVIADPLATSNDVAQVVHKSPSLASHLLRIVNSACYGFPSRIDRISRAVTIRHYQKTQWLDWPGFTNRQRLQRSDLFALRRIIESTYLILSTWMPRLLIFCIIVLR